MKRSKIEKLNNFLKSLSLDKIEQIKVMHAAGTLTKEVMDRLIIFKDIVLDEGEISELVSDDYISIEARMAVLNKGSFYDEIVWVGLLFLQDENDDRALYDGNLNISKDSFKKVLYHLCIALHHSGKYKLCQPHIDLLQKLVIAYPSHFNPPKDILDKIGYDCYREEPI